MSQAGHHRGNCIQSARVGAHPPNLAVSTSETAHGRLPGRTGNPSRISETLHHGDGQLAAVASGNDAATRAAISVIRRGGSAVDAAIAADAVMGVCEPTATGIGGDVMALVATGGEVFALNGSGRSPRHVLRREVPDNGHGYVPSVGGWAVTVPGAVRAWHDLHERFGRLGWSTILEPAIEAARDGVRIGSTGSRLWRGSRSRLDDQGLALYFAGGRAPDPGAIWHNPALAKSLERLATEGPDGLYRGRFASDIENAVAIAGGALSTSDLEQHRSEWVEPLSVGIGEYDLVTVPPPCQGVVVALAAQTLHQAELLGAFSPTTAPRAAASATVALDRAFAVALECVADPLVADVPSYEEFRQKMASAPTGGPMPLGPGTVFTVVFTAEQAVVLTSSVCDRFGSGVTVASGGFVLQSRGRGFSTDTSHRNSYGPAKRPYHTIVPTLLMHRGDAKPAMGLGVVGGVMQPQGQLQIIHRVLGGMPLSQAVQAGRFRLLGDGIVGTEETLESSWRREIAAQGYEIREGASVVGGFGGAQAVHNTSEALSAASDPRRDGTAAVIKL